MNDVYVTDIIDISFPDGYGVARHDGLVIFVPGCVPGDKVEIRTVKRNNRFAYGEPLQITVPSPSRVTPLCPHFIACGGCTMQNLAYETQLYMKERYLKETLKRIGKIDVSNIDTSPIVHSPEQTFYRGKIELAFGEGKNGIMLGMRKRASHSGQYLWEVTPINECYIFSETLKHILPLFNEFVQKNKLSAFNPLTGKGLLRHLILRESKHSKDIMLILETTNGKLPDLSGLWKNITTEVPCIKSMYRVINPNPGDAIKYETLVRLFGNPYIVESMGDMELRVYPDSFFQPNPKGAHLLYTRLAEFVQKEDIKDVTGLYCGAGAIELFLSRYVKEVTGIDSSHKNIATAKENCIINRIKNCSFKKGRIEDVLKTLNLTDIDLLVTDPPREGITKEGLSSILNVKSKTIAYVSCNPSTLARDLKIFIENGYSLTEIYPFDFFPHSSHLETLAILKL